jgi:hypothetical protein
MLGDPNTLASVLQSTTTIAGIAIALDSALYIGQRSSGGLEIPRFLTYLVAVAGGVCVLASIKVIKDLVSHETRPLSALFRRTEYAFMLLANVLLVVALILLHVT